MKRAVYAGSFDPITNGHLWMVERGVELFDELWVAIGVNSDKKTAFSMEERMQMVRRSVLHLPRVRIDHFSNQFLVDYARSIGANFVLRGIRDANDFGYERGMRHINEDLHSSVTTVFLMPPRGYSEVSSSLVKGLVGPEGWQDVVRRYVPEPVFEQLVKRHASST